jgi:putative toxin-antitoxin system antitoxin component (TIGR02293 family)
MTVKSRRGSAVQPITASLPVAVRVQRLLGLPASAGSDRRLAELVEDGLPTKTVGALRAELGLDWSELSPLVVKRRTWARRRAAARLSSEESDRVMRVARILALARATFPGDEHYAEVWLREPKRRFDGKAPLALLTTEASARRVEEMLLQIQEGVFA